MAPRKPGKPRGHIEISWAAYQDQCPIVEAVPAGGWVTGRIGSLKVAAWCPAAGAVA